MENGFTIPNLFLKAGEVMTGIMTLTTNFVTGLWENPLGQITIVLTIVSGAVGLAYRIFLRRKKV